MQVQPMSVVNLNGSPHVSTPGMTASYQLGLNAVGTLIDCGEQVFLFVLTINFNEMNS